MANRMTYPNRVGLVLSGELDHDNLDLQCCFLERFSSKRKTGWQRQKQKIAR